MGNCQIIVPRDSEGSDGLSVADFVAPNGLWTLGDMETDFPPNLLSARIAAIIRQPDESPAIEPPEPSLGDPEAIIEVNNPWEVDVRWELVGSNNVLRLLCGVWRVKLFLESLGCDDLDCEAKYPNDICFDGRKDSYHAQFKFDPDQLKVEADEGTPFQLTVAVIFMIQCPCPKPQTQPRPTSIIGKVNLPLIQCFREEVLLFSSSEKS